MGICRDGLGIKVKPQVITTFVSKEEPLIQLANSINWNKIADIASPDLKKTKKGLWWLGRKLYLRIHLAVIILQALFKWTDRGTERFISQTPIFQIFCGFGLFSKWKCPDHTKIEVFRNRLSPAVYKQIGDYIILLAKELGFADPSWMDLDSTVQEANMSYPSDANLLRKLALKCTEVLSFLKEKGKKYLPESIDIDIVAINKKAKEYFFLAKNTAIEKKREIFASYHHLVKVELKAFIHFVENLSPQAYSHLPWNIQKTVTQIKNDGWRYLLDVAHFIRTHTIKSGKILSFHCKEVACIKKGKVGKDKEFGRIFQLGRIGGNFMIALACSSIKMGDKASLVPAIEEHQNIFGKNVLETVATDKGYFSKNNVQAVIEISGNSNGMQRPTNVKDQVVGHQVEILKNRRAGIEPLIGHVKEFGLRKSKMKTDDSTVASGYRSVMGFNLHQIIRNMAGEVI